MPELTVSCYWLSTLGFVSLDVEDLAQEPQAMVLTCRQLWPLTSSTQFQEEVCVKEKGRQTIVKGAVEVCRELLRPPQFSNSFECRTRTCVTQLM